MSWQYSPYLTPLLIAALICISLAIYLWRQPHPRGTTAFIILMLAVGEWSFGYALEVGSLALSAKILFAKAQYFGITATPVAWLAFAFQYTNRNHWLTRHNLIFLTIIPLITLVLVWTNEYHGFMWRNTYLEKIAGFYSLVLDHGPWFWVYVTYSYLLLIWGTFILLQTLLRQFRMFRGQAHILIIGVLAPWIGNALYISGASPFQNLDLTPLAFTVTGVAGVLGLYRYRLFEIMPLARGKIVDSFGDCVIVLDELDRIVDLNQAAQQLLNHQSAKAVGQPVTEIFTHQPEMQRYLQSPIVETQIEIALSHDQQQRFYDLQIAYLNNDLGHLSGRMIVLHDITKRKQTEFALREREMRLRSIIDAALDGVIMIDAQGIVTDWNSQAEVLFGWSKAEAAGSPLRTLIIPPAYQEAHERGLAHFLATKEGPILNKRVEITALHRTGREFPVELTVSVIPHEETYLFNAFIRDITDQKLAEEALQVYANELEQSNQELKDFVHIASHDLQEPLRKIRVFAERLTSTYHEDIDTRGQDYLARMQNSTKRMQALINDLLAYSRITTDSRPFIPVDLNLILQGVISDLEISIEEKAAKLQVDHLPTIEADPTQMRQLLQNIISNGLKFQQPDTPPLITIQTLTHTNPKYTTITITDNGIGIEKKFIDHIFGVFSTLAQSSRI